MTQNIYDNADFFAGYGRLARSSAGLAGAPEWPSLRALFPALHGLSVVDLGCGFGWACRWVREQGASRVLGLDISERMLTRAREMTADPAITYAKVDLEQLDLPPASCDLVYSSLALHYVETLTALFTRVHRALVPGGHLIFSVEHPIFTAPGHPGWSPDQGGRGSWPVNGYLEEGPRSTNWLVQGVVKQHRTIGSYFSLLRHAGFTVTHLEEWGPTDEQIAAHPIWAQERDRPPFLLMAARA